MTQRFGIPKWVFTDDPDNQFGQSRVQVDVGQTGFFTGREMRTFYEFNIPSAGSLVIKAQSDVDVFLNQFIVDLWAAELRVELIAGGTEGGTFSTALPSLKANGINQTYISQVAMSAGGTHSGGTVQDLFQLYAVQNPAKGSATEAGSTDPLGFPAGTYYIKLTNINSVAATGVFKARWEERPEGV